MNRIEKIVVLLLMVILTGCVGKESETTADSEQIEGFSVAQTSEASSETDSVAVNRPESEVSSAEHSMNVEESTSFMISSSQTGTGDEAFQVTFSGSVAGVASSTGLIELEAGETSIVADEEDGVGSKQVLVENATAAGEMEQPQTEEATPVATAWVDTSEHNYYKGLSAEQAAQADAVAQQIANTVMATGYASDLERIHAAAEIVAGYCASDTYEVDANNYYCSPYGVFVAGVYTCAGSTRALGRVLDYMGYSWKHTNENQWRHQWCILSMDGQVGFADGMGGYAGYGEMTNGMTLEDGTIIYFAE